MRKLVLFILICLCGYVSYSQGAWQSNSVKTRFNNGLGVTVKDTTIISLADTAQLIIRPSDSIPYYRYKSKWLSFIRNIDTSNMLSGYLRSGNQQSISNKVNYSDTASMLNNYRTQINSLVLDSSYQANQIALRVRYIDTAAIVANYLRKSDTTTMLSGYSRDYNTVHLNGNETVTGSKTFSNQQYFGSFSGSYGGQSIIVASIATNNLVAVGSANNSIASGVNQVLSTGGSSPTYAQGDLLGSTGNRMFVNYNNYRGHWDTAFSISQNGVLRIRNSPPNGTSTDSILVWKGADSTIGKIAQSSAITASGSYTPTYTNVSNMSSMTNVYTSYMRVGSIVMVQGSATISVTSTNTATSFQISLPVSSALTSNPVSGTGSWQYSGGLYQGNVASVFGSGNTAIVGFYSNGATSGIIYYSFNYTIN